MKPLKCIFASAMAIVAVATFITLAQTGDKGRNNGQQSRAEATQQLPLPASRAPGTLRIASLNCYNYLSENRRTDDEKYKRNWPKPEKERKAMCDLVEAIRPDVLALQEIGGKDQMNQFADDLGRRGIVFPHRKVLYGRDLARRIAIISTQPFTRTFELPERSDILRGLLGVQISDGDKGSITIFTVHLKSKYTRNEADPECNEERLREAKHIQRLVKELGKDNFVLLGDFNETPENPPIKVFTKNKFAIRLDPRDEAGNRWTYRNEKHGFENTLDHIFIAPKLASKRLVPNSAKIADSSISKRASDHRMIYVDLKHTSHITP